MALIGEMQYLTIGDSTYSIPTSGGSTVSITRSLTSGTKSATITVDGTSYDIYSMTVPTNISAFTNDSGYITSADVPEGASAYTGTISAVGTSASSGTNNGFARGDHVHNLTGTVVKSALGTGSGTTKFLREDGSWATPAYTTNTDTKVSTAAATSNSTYYPVMGTDTTSAETKYYDKAGFVYYTANGIAGDASAIGQGRITLGNSTSFSSTSGKKGVLRLYGVNTNYIDLVANVSSSNKTITFPNADGTVALTSDIPTISYPVTSVNTKTGAVSLTASDVDALPASTVIPTKTSDLTNDSGFITSYTDEKVKTVNISGTTKQYLVFGTRTGTETKMTSVGLGYTESSGIGTLAIGYPTTSGRVRGQITLNGNSSNIVTITSSNNTANRTITLPDASGTVALTSDIPSVPSWALASSKPTYTASEVGALPSTTTIPTKVSDLTNDSGLITGYTEPDPTVPSWAKASSKPTYTASEVDAISTSHIVNGITSTDIDNWNKINAVGTVYSSSRSVAITVANINTYAEGASLTLPAGTYIVYGSFTFNSVTGARITDIDICNVGGTTAASGSELYARQRVAQGAGNWVRLETSCIVVLTAQSPVYVKGSATLTSTAQASEIRAVRIL